MLSSKDHVLKLQKLLALEKQQEQEQHKLALEKFSLSDLAKQGICWYPLYIEETGYGLGDYPFIIVKRTQNINVPHKFDGGKSVALFTNSSKNEYQEIKGTVHYCNDQRMKIIFYHNDLPDWIDDGKLGVKLLFDEASYREMDRALKNLLEADKNRLAELREIAFGFKESEFELDVAYSFYSSLNESQNLAIKNTLQTLDISIIHGPPGTGKTTTVVQLVRELLKTEKQVLLCAPSNSAADLLTERLAANGVVVVRVGNLSRIDQEILQHTIDEKIVKHSEYKRAREYTKRAGEMRQMANKYKRQFGYAEREQRRLLLKEAKDLMREAIALEDFLASQVVDNAQAIVTTLVGSNGKFLEGRLFKTCIIDEAAQALEPACWIPISKSARVILSGDPYQLPPVIKSVGAQKEGLGVTMMERCIKFLPGVNLLKVQYRMNEAIMGFSNEYFYGGKLTAHESVTHHTVKAINNAPLEFIDTAGAGYNEEINPESLSYFNSEEARIIQQHLEQLSAHFIEPVTVGIIAPYREQVNFLNKYISIESPYLYLNINTVDSFQGRECDVIYISMVRSNDNGEIGFLQEYRRMNVALTRARQKLVLVGDSATLCNDSFYIQLVEYFQKRESYKSVFETEYYQA